MANNKEKFQRAIRGSLELLQNSGKTKITKSEIIDNAKFDDGSSVGKSTLYAKNPVTKEYIHADLLKELDEKLISKSPKIIKTHIKRSKKQIVEEKNKEIKDLKQKNSRLLAQFVSLENSFEKTVHLNAENNIQSLETNLYIVTVLLDQKLGGYKKLNNIIKNFEVKYHESSRLKEAKDQVQRMKNDIECSRIIPIMESFKDS